MKLASMTIGTLAEMASVGAETIRYYEREGLLPKPARSRSGYRVYPDEAVERVRFIRRAKDLGFTLEEISELLALKVTHGKSCLSVRNRALAKLSDIDGKMSDLRRMRRALSALVERCSGDEGIDDCTILDAIAHGTKQLTKDLRVPKRRSQEVS